MKNRIRQKNGPRSDLVLEARAGVIPSSDDIEDERRARIKRIDRVLSVLNGSEGQAITDLMADLHHYCHWKGLPFHKFSRAASRLYIEEKDELAASSR